MACDSPYMVKPSTGTDMVPVPCGKCAPCKQRRVSQWVFRLTQEELKSTSSHFVTLTYDTEHVPITKNGYMTLEKTDLQKFFKRLRKLCPGETIKYYAVGEYGTTKHRPHYHAIIFNVSDTANYMTAWTLHGLPLGSVHVGTVTTASVAYTMKYIDKPSKSRFHSRDDRQKEFPLMSKKLGDNYLSDDIVKYHRENLDKNYVTQVGGEKIAMPKYYRDKILSDGDKLEQREIIKLEIDRIRVDAYLDYLHNPKVPEWDFQQYQDHEREARHNKFYRSQQLKKRDL